MYIHRDRGRGWGRYGLGTDTSIGIDTSPQGNDGIRELLQKDEARKLEILFIPFPLISFPCGKY